MPAIIQPPAVFDRGAGSAHNGRRIKHWELFREGTRERGAALLEFALSAPLLAVLIIGIAQVARVAAWRYQLSVVTHAIMREVAGGTSNEFILTKLANGYARASGMGMSSALAVTVEPAVCAGTAGSRVPLGVFRSIAVKMAPGTRVRVRGVIPLSGAAGRVWKAGFPVECSVVVLSDPWKSPMGMVKDWLLGKKAGEAR